MITLKYNGKEYSGTLSGAYTVTDHNTILESFNYLTVNDDLDYFNSVVEDRLNSIGKEYEISNNYLVVDSEEELKDIRSSIDLNSLNGVKINDITYDFVTTQDETVVLDIVSFLKYSFKIDGNVCIILNASGEGEVYGVVLEAKRLVNNTLVNSEYIFIDVDEANTKSLHSMVLEINYGINMLKVKVLKFENDGSLYTIVSNTYTGDVEVYNSKITIDNKSFMLIKLPTTTDIVVDVLYNDFTNTRILSKSQFNNLDNSSDIMQALNRLYSKNSLTIYNKLYYPNANNDIIFNNINDINFTDVYTLTNALDKTSDVNEVMLSSVSKDGVNGMLTSFYTYSGTAKLFVPYSGTNGVELYFKDSINNIEKQWFTPKNISPIDLIGDAQTTYGEMNNTNLSISDTLHPTANDFRKYENTTLMLTSTIGDEDNLITNIEYLVDNYYKIGDGEADIGVISIVKDVKYGNYAVDETTLTTGCNTGWFNNEGDNSYRYNMRGDNDRLKWLRKGLGRSLSEKLKLILPYKHKPILTNDLNEASLLTSSPDTNPSTYDVIRGSIVNSYDIREKGTDGNRLPYVYKVLDYGDKKITLRYRTPSFKIDETIGEWFVVNDKLLNIDGESSVDGLISYGKSIDAKHYCYVTLNGIKLNNDLTINSETDITSSYPIDNLEYLIVLLCTKDRAFFLNTKSDEYLIYGKFNDGTTNQNYTTLTTIFNKDFINYDLSYLDTDINDIAYTYNHSTGKINKVDGNGYNNMSNIIHNVKDYGIKDNVFTYINSEKEVVTFNIENNEINTIDLQGYKPIKIITDGDRYVYLDPNSKDGFYIDGDFSKYIKSGEDNSGVNSTLVTWFAKRYLRVIDVSLSKDVFYVVTHDGTVWYKTVSSRGLKPNDTFSMTRDYDKIPLIRNVINVKDDIITCKDGGQYLVNREVNVTMDNLAYYTTKSIPQPINLRMSNRQHTIDVISNII